MKQVLSIFITFFTLNLLSQSVGIGTTIPDTTAILDLSSTSKGLLIPRMDSISRTLIAAPSQGLMIYQTNGNKGFYYHNGTAWQKIGGDGNEWTKNGANEIYTTKTIGIGNSNPDDYAMLDITSTEKGILIPRMTETQRNAILNPDGGLLIYQTGINKGLYHFDGGDDTWKKVGDGPFSWTDGTGIVYTNNRVGIGNTNPNNSALLDLTSTTKGFLLPRMTTAQRDAITTPVQGLKIFNTDDRCEDTYDGQKWAKNCNMRQNGEATLPANNWWPRADYPGGERYYTSCFSIGTKIYMGLGQRTVNDSTIRKDFWEYNTETDVWTRKADFGGGFRTEAVGFSIGSKGYFGTGYDGVNNKKDFWEYDPVTNIWTQKLDFGGLARQNAVGFSIGSKGYIGTGGSNSGDTNDFWEYDPSLNTWTQKANYGGLPGDASVGFSIGSNGYIGGGFDINGLTADFWKFTPAGSGLGAWTQIADYGAGQIAFASGFSIGNKGFVGAGNTAPKDFWEYNPTTNIWVKKANIGGKNKTASCVCAVGTKGYIGTGSEESNLPRLDDFWVYNSEPELGKEYVETIPKDAIFYKSYDWTSEGNKLSTTLTNVNTEINGTLVVTDSTILDGIKIKNFGIQAYSPYAQNYILRLQENGEDLDIGSSSSPYSKVKIYGNSIMYGISDQGILHIGNPSTQGLKIDRTKIQGVAGFNTSELQLQPFGGDIGIGLSNSYPDALLHLKGQQNNDFRHIMLEDDNSSAYSLVTCSDNFVVINSSNTGDFIFRNATTSEDVLSVSPAGNIIITGSSATKDGGSSSWITSSDRRLKKNIKSYNEGLSKIVRINPVTYQFNGINGQDSIKENVGVIAQELREIAPYMVLDSEKLAPDGTSYLQLDNSAMTYMLINAVKELANQNEELKTTLRQTQTSNETQSSINLDLKSRLEKLETLIAQINKQ